LLILTLDENSTIDKLDISIINIIVQYINIALINIVTIHKLSLVARYDGLTGLLRRETFYDMLSYTLQMAKRTGKVFSIVYVDMDGLKFINDTHGHEYGDTALKILAETLKSNLRSSDVCARIGGDEFMVLLNDTDNPEKFVKRTKEDLLSKKLPDINVKVSASFGYYVYDGDEDIDVETMIKRADERMYEDKKGKND
jgi:diguanylate cyclase (GGDEF)-like protein